MDTSWRKLRHAQNLFLTVISVPWQQLQLINKISGRSSFSGRNCGPWRAYARNLFANCISQRGPIFELGKTVKAWRAAKSNCCWLIRSPYSQISCFIWMEEGRGVVCEGMMFSLRRGLWGKVTLDFVFVSYHPTLHLRDNKLNSVSQDESCLPMVATGKWPPCLGIIFVMNSSPCRQDDFLIV